MKPATSESSPESINMPLQGILWMVVTTFMFVAVTGIVRYLGSSLPAAEAAFIRYGIGLLILLPVYWRMARSMPSVAVIRNGAIRGFVHTFGVVLWFFAMARIPIAEVTAIGYVTPICVTIGAAIFLGERLRARRIMGVLAGLFGALIILRPGFNEISIGQLAQLSTAPLFATSFLMTKRMTGHTDPQTIVALLTFFCTLFLFPLALLDWQPPTTHEIFWLAMTALCATYGHYAMTRALAAAPISVTQPISFLQLVWATILGIVMFGEAVDPFVILGGTVIVSAATFISHRESKMARKTITPPAPATKFQ